MHDALWLLLCDASHLSEISEQDSGAALTRKFTRPAVPICVCQTVRLSVSESTQCHGPTTPLAGERREQYEGNLGVTKTLSRGKKSIHAKLRAFFPKRKKIKPKLRVNENSLDGQNR